MIPSPSVLNTPSWLSLVLGGAAGFWRGHFWRENRSALLASQAGEPLSVLFSIESAWVPPKAQWLRPRLRRHESFSVGSTSCGLDSPAGALHRLPAVGPRACACTP